MSGPKTWDVVGVGCNSVDYVYRLPAAPVANTPTAKLRIAGHSVSCGGQMATAMAGCAALGLRAAYLGAVGDDANGRRILAELETRGVDVSQVLTRDCANRFAVITVDPAGERIVLWDRDERLGLARNEIPAALIASARLVHVDDEDQEAAIIAATLARDANVPCTSDIERVTDRTMALVSAVSVPIFSEHALPGFTGESDPERALRTLRRTHDGMLCVTLGARGAMLLAGNDLIHAPAVAVTAVDSTGAGDVFRAGFIYAMLHDKPAREILRFANAAAAVSCTRAGAMASVASEAEVSSLAAKLR
jgi:sugar/nucleoside kinase (ribokinase family)